MDVPLSPLEYEVDGKQTALFYADVEAAQKELKQAQTSIEANENNTAELRSTIAEKKSRITEIQTLLTEHEVEASRASLIPFEADFAITRLRSLLVWRAPA